MVLDQAMEIDVNIATPSAKRYNEDNEKAAFEEERKGERTH